MEYRNSNAYPTLLFVFVFGGCSSLGNGSLVDRLISSDADISKTAVAKYSAMDESARSRLHAEFFSALNDPHVDTRRRAVTAMGMIAAQDDQVLPGLTKALTDTDSRVRLDAIDGFAKVHTVPPQAVPLIIDMLKAGGRYSSPVAAQVLAKINNPEAKMAVNAFLLEEDIRYFGWRTGDKATFKYGVRYGSQMLPEDGAYLIRETTAVKRDKGRITATVIETMWHNYGTGVPTNRKQFTYVADSGGVYVDLKVLEGKALFRDTRRIYIARIPLAENVSDPQFGTIIRKFGAPPQFSFVNPESNCVLIKMNADYITGPYTGFYQTYCQGVGLVSFSDDKPDLDAGVPGIRSTYVFIMEKFAEGQGEAVRPVVSRPGPQSLPKALQGNVLTNVSASELRDSPGQYKNRLIQIRGRVGQIINGKGQQIRVGIYEAGKNYNGWNYVPLLSEEFVEPQNIVMVDDSEGGIYAIYYKKELNVPSDGSEINIVGRFLGNAFGMPGKSGALYVSPGLGLEATSDLDPLSKTRLLREQPSATSLPKGKDATQMGLDELNQYLKRGSAAGGQGRVEAGESWNGRESEAIEYVKHFPTRSRKARFPLSVEDALKRRARRPLTIDQAIEGFMFRILETMLEEAGCCSALAENEAEAKAEEIYKEKVSPRWSSSQMRGPIYRVTHSTALRFNSNGPGNPKPFEVNLEKGTVKPLTFISWLALDSDAAGRWAKTTGAGSRSIDSDVSAVAPAYSGKHAPGSLSAAAYLESRRKVAGVGAVNQGDDGKPGQAEMATDAREQETKSLLRLMGACSKRDADIAVGSILGHTSPLALQNAWNQDSTCQEFEQAFSTYKVNYENREDHCSYLWTQCRELFDTGRCGAMENWSRTYSWCH